MTREVFIMAGTVQTGFPVYGTAASIAAAKTFQDNLTKNSKTDSTQGSKTSMDAKNLPDVKPGTAEKRELTQAAVYESAAQKVRVSAYNRRGESITAEGDKAQTAVTTTGSPTSQVSGFARAGAVTGHADYGKVVGEPKLSEEGAKYYDELKKKFKGLEFVLVGRDSVQAAKQQEQSYANGNRLVVLIDEDKIEQMAKDAKFRNHYEGIIEQARSGQWAQAQAKARVVPKMGGNGRKGPNVLDNGAGGFLAASARANKEFAKKITKMREKKKAEKKEEVRREEKRLKEEKRREKMEEEREVLMNEETQEEPSEKGHVDIKA